MRSTILAVLVTVCTFCGAAFAADGGEADFYAGHASLERGDAEGSIAHFTKALASNSLDETQKAYVYHYRAVAYQKIGRHQEAIDDYSEALALGSLPKQVQAAVYYNRAIGLDSLSKHKEAIKDFTSAIALKSDYAEAFMNRGNAYRKIGQPQQALRDYEASSKYGNPMKHLPYFGRGLVLEELGQTQAAYDAFKIAASLAPADFGHAAKKVAEYDAGRAPTRIASAPPPAEGVTAAIRPNTQSERRPPSAAPAPTAPATSNAKASSDGSPAASAAPGLIDLPTSPVADRATAEAEGQTAALEEPAKAPASSAAKTKKPEPASSSAPAAATQAKAAQPSQSSPSATSSVSGATVSKPAATQPASANKAPAKTTPKPVQSASLKPSGYLVQIASYNSEAGALTEAEAIKRRNPGTFDAVQEFIVKADLGSRGTYWRLQYGPFQSRADSEAFCRTLKSKGIDCIIAVSKG